MFWFTNLYAPQPSKSEVVLNNIDQKSLVKYEEEQTDLFLDSLDVKDIKHLKMSKVFTKNDRKKVRHIAKELGIKPNWLYKIFYIECRGQIHKSNPYSGAVGLIGFLPETAKKLGTSSEELKQMTVDQQLDYVYKYFKLALNNDKRIHKPADLYLAIFSPLDLGKHDSTIIGKRKNHDISKKIYHQNKALDTDNDSVISVKDINKFVSLL